MASPAHAVHAVPAAGHAVIAAVHADGCAVTVHAVHAVPAAGHAVVLPIHVVTAHAVPAAGHAVVLPAHAVPDWTADDFAAAAAHAACHAVLLIAGLWTVHAPSAVHHAAAHVDPFPDQNQAAPDQRHGGRTCVPQAHDTYQMTAAVAAPQATSALSADYLLCVLDCAFVTEAGCLMTQPLAAVKAALSLMTHPVAAAAADLSLMTHPVAAAAAALSCVTHPVAAAAAALSCCMTHSMPPADLRLLPNQIAAAEAQADAVTAGLVSLSVQRQSHHAVQCLLACDLANQPEHSCLKVAKLEDLPVLCLRLVVRHRHTGLQS